MKKRLFGLVGLCLLSMMAWADTVTLKDGHPETYTVQKGDTLWGISGMFLEDPWLWPEIWQVNPEIDNPHLIFPGDVIRLVWVDGKPRIVVDRGPGSSTVKLTPEMRMEPIDQAIPAIPLDRISAWLTRSRIVDPKALEGAPYVLSGEDGRIIGGAGDKIYGRGSFPEGERLFGIYRPAKRAYVDPETNEVLGVLARDIGSSRLVATEGDIGTLTLSEANEEVRIGDVFLPYVEQKIQAIFQPKTPNGDIEGVILAGEGAVSHVGRYDVVVVNRGEREGLEVGDVLAIYNHGGVINDFVSQEAVKLPDTRVGLMMIVRTFEKASYGIILESQKPVRVMDVVKSP